MSESRYSKHKIIIWVFVITAIIIISSIAIVIIYPLFASDAGDDGDHVVLKPAIYLYPQETLKIKVSLSINGEITISEPEYNNGWDVVVEPGGKIEDSYDYLFYEARLNYLKTPDEGWCVEYEHLELWMNNTLKELGLNEKESKDLKVFWLDFLPIANYYEIKLLSKEYLDSNMGLIIDPTPETIIRVMLTFSPYQNAVEIDTPLIKTPIRSGFTVVEWGGFLI
ncbi:MAG: hypothetical protein ACXAC5_21525 [Promethearchaeota archaeon]|jgi:hypothetical protein